MLPFRSERSSAAAVRAPVGSAQCLQQCLNRLLLGGRVLGVPDRGEDCVVLAVDEAPGLPVERLEFGLVFVPSPFVGVDGAVQPGLVALDEVGVHAADQSTKPGYVGGGEMRSRLL